MTLNLVKGEFTELEDALRAQVQKMEAELTDLTRHNKKLLEMVAKRDTKIEDLEILVEGHRETIREYKHELKKLQVDKELLKGRIEELDHRHFEDTPITFDDD